MDDTTPAPLGRIFEPAIAYAFQLYSFYEIIGLRWHWDRFDLLILAEGVLFLGVALGRDIHALHHNYVVLPRALGLASERAAKKHRRAMVAKLMGGRR